MKASGRDWVLRTANSQYWMCMLSIVDQSLMHRWIGLSYHLGNLISMTLREEKSNTYYPWMPLIAQQSN